MSLSIRICLFLVNVAFSSASVLSHLPSLLFRRDNQCAEYMVVWARGTSESPPLGKVGTPLLGNLSQAVGDSNINFIGVSYAADVTGYLMGGDPDGSSSMAATATGAVNSCPDANVILAGYSQGAQLVHNAVSQLSPDIAGKISSVVTFGDPDKSDAMANIDQSKVKIYCHDGDLICEGTSIILTPHRTYGIFDAANAADFILSKGTNTSSGSSSSSSSGNGIGSAPSITRPMLLLFGASLFGAIATMV